MLRVKRIQETFLISIVLLLILACLPIICGCTKKTDTVETIIETDSLTDIDGNVYKTVKIGEQWWMSENLKVKRYRNGDSIPFIGSKPGTNVFDSTKWRVSVNEGAYCILDGKDSTSANFNGKKFGVLYNAYTLNNPKNIAPAGWHVPTDTEWKELEIQLGMSNEESEKVSWRGTNEGNELKIQKAWYFPSNKYKIWGSNESGFSALGSSCIMFDGQDANPGITYNGFWWTASEQGAEQWYRYLDYNKAGVFRYFGPKTYGFSIRCVKDF
jgi:uncharacterized protein (TIGR02145 family)